MAEYIEREALISEFKRLTLGENSLIERIFADGVYAVLETFPAADVVEVKHGRWMPYGFGKEIMCSVCRCELGDAWEYRYCPDCGAKMDGERRSE